jgi:hypothetical protein
VVLEVEEAQDSLADEVLLEEVEVVDEEEAGK